MIDVKIPRRINPKGIGLIYIYIYIHLPPLSYIIPVVPVLGPQAWPRHVSTAATSMLLGLNYCNGVYRFRAHILLAARKGCARGPICVQAGADAGSAVISPACT